MLYILLRLIAIHTILLFFHAFFYYNYLSLIFCLLHTYFIFCEPKGSLIYYTLFFLCVFLCVIYHKKLSLKDESDESPNPRNQRKKHSYLKVVENMNLNVVVTFVLLLFVTTQSSNTTTYGCIDSSSTTNIEGVK